MAFKNLLPDVGETIRGGYKNRIPQTIDTTLNAGVKNFTVSSDLVAGTAQKVLARAGFKFAAWIEYLDDLPVGVSPLGTLVFDSLTVPASAYTIINTKGETVTVNYAGIEIETIVFEASQQKNIVKTSIAGRDGSIKEYISSNDTAITMRGAIVNSLSGAYPRRDVQNLLGILKVPQQIRVLSKFINDILGFTHITIESWAFNQTPGMRNVQAFTITAVNDVSPEADETFGALLPTTA